jgi:hypothetical protein
MGSIKTLDRSLLSDIVDLDSIVPASRSDEVGVERVESDCKDSI